MYRIAHDAARRSDFPWVISRNGKFMTSFSDEQTAMSKLIELEKNGFRFLDCNASGFQSPLDLIDKGIEEQGGDSLSIQHCRDGRVHFSGRLSENTFMYLLLDNSVITQIKNRLPTIREFEPRRRFDD